MKKNLLLLGGLLMLASASARQWHPLQTPPDTIDTFHEIATVYNPDLVKHFNDLTPQERVFIYYLYRASLPGNKIAADQLHRHSLDVTAMMEFIFDNRDTLQKKSSELNSINVECFLNEVKTYLVYLWTNHSSYFVIEHINEKRTPEKLHLSSLTKNNLKTILTLLGYPDIEREVERLSVSIFDSSAEPTLVVPDSIEKSAVNFYATDFTESDFKQLKNSEAHKINTYFYIDYTKEKRTPKVTAIKVGGKFDKELLISVFWLEKALDHVKKFPQEFDNYIIESLDYLIAFLKTGDEELFKKHSIAWAKTKSRVDYCFGFIETYEDPKSYRGLFQAEATIKSIDMDKLNVILPTLEAQLPFPKEFKRQNLGDLSAVPNASINAKVFSVGALGPLNVVLAYCLPNYEELRSEHGSKQIIYDEKKSLAEQIDRETFYKLLNSSSHLKWLQEHNASQLGHDIFTLLTILHETVGHASGKLFTHTFKDGDSFEVEGNTYKIGQTIQVTNENLKEFLTGYRQALEELRAEVIALLSAVIGYDEIAQAGFLKEWPQKINKEKMLELIIREMGRSGIFRLRGQQEGATEIAGDHARANNTILNYLIEKGSLEYVLEEVEHNGNKHTVLDVKVVNLERAIEDIITLANEVQRIKSTGDTQAIHNLMKTYGVPIVRPEFITILKNNYKAIIGDLKLSALLIPFFEPIKNDNHVVDIIATWPSDIVEQHLKTRELVYSME